MKNYILPFCILALVSCKEDEPQPIEADPFVGTWIYNNSGLELAIRFTVSNTGGEYAFSNIDIDYAEIPEGDPYTYGIEVYDKYADNDGFGNIKIHGGNETSWVFINLYNNQVSNKKILSRDMQIDMVNRNPIELEGQEFTKQ